MQFRGPKNIQCIELHVNPCCWIFHACVADQCLSKAEDGTVHCIRSRKPSVRMRLCQLVNICICLHICLQRTLHYSLQESFTKKEFMSKSHIFFILMRCGVADFGWRGPFCRKLNFLKFQFRPLWTLVPRPRVKPHGAASRGPMWRRELRSQGF